MVEQVDTYDAGLLNDFGGGDVSWWQDYIRAELGHAHEFYGHQADNIRIAAEARGMEKAAKIAEQCYYGSALTGDCDTEFKDRIAKQVAAAIRAALNGGQHE